MDNSAFWTSRSELVNWINVTLNVKLTKIEETSNGAFACQLLDMLHPGQVPLWKIDFNATAEYELVSNYKVLQDCFNKLQIDKDIDVPKIIKGRPLDSLEFMQWFKGYWDKVTHGNPIGSDVDPALRRLECKTGDYRPRTAGLKTKAANGSSSFSATGRRSPGKEENKGRAEALQKEKEFYFQKLRDIELLIQTPGLAELPVLKRIEEILYAPTQQEGHRILLEAQRALVADAEAEAHEHGAASALATEGAGESSEIAAA